MMFKTINEWSSMLIKYYTNQNKKMLNLVRLFTASVQLLFFTYMKKFG